MPFRPVAHPCQIHKRLGSAHPVLHRLEPFQIPFRTPFRTVQNTLAFRFVPCRTLLRPGAQTCEIRKVKERIPLCTYTSVIHRCCTVPNTVPCTFPYRSNSRSLHHSVLCQISFRSVPYRALYRFVPFLFIPFRTVSNTVPHLIPFRTVPFPTVPYRAKNRSIYHSVPCQIPFLMPFRTVLNTVLNRSFSYGTVPYRASYRFVACHKPFHSVPYLCE